MPDLNYYNMEKWKTGKSVMQVGHMIFQYLIIINIFYCITKSLCNRVKNKFPKEIRIKKKGNKYQDVGSTSFLLLVIMRDYSVRLITIKLLYALNRYNYL